MMYGPMYAGKPLKAVSVICFRMPGAYLGLKFPEPVIEVTGLFEALSLFGDEASVAWDRDVDPWLDRILEDYEHKAGVGLRRVAGVFWPGSENGGKLWLGMPSPVWHWHRESCSWRLGHGGRR